MFGWRNEDQEARTKKREKGGGLIQTSESMISSEENLWQVGYDQKNVSLTDEDCISRGKKARGQSHMRIRRECE